jgi:hypothetical protein
MGASGRSLTAREKASLRRHMTSVARLQPGSSAQIIDEAHGFFGRASELRHLKTQEALNSIDGLIGHWGG